MDKENLQKEKKIFGFLDEKDKKSKIVRYPSTSHFTHINNIAINDENVSDSALGVLLYILSKPCDWVIYVSQLCCRFKRSKSKMYSVIEELISLGYMRRRQERHPTRGYVTGWITEASDYPIFLEPPSNLLDPNLQDLVKTRSCKTNATNIDKYKERQLQKNNNKQNKKTNLTNKQKNVVVVSLMKTLEDLAISQTLIETWVKQHGVDYVNEKIALMRASNPKNPEC